MGVELPSPFTDIRTATSMPPNSDVHIIGVVSDSLPPKKSSGTDWTCTFSVADSTLGFFGELGFEGVKVRFFRKLEKELPQIRGKGDVVILRAMKIKQFNGTTFVMSSFGSTWTVIRASSIPEAVPANLVHIPHIKEPKAPTFKPSEMWYVIEVFNHFDKSSYTSNETSAVTPADQDGKSVQTSNFPTRDKFRLIKDAEISTFYDLVGQVIKIFPANGKSDLYISDYTANQLLYFYQWGQDEDGEDGMDDDAREGDEYSYISRVSRNTKQWPGPFGKLTLPVTLWSPHSEYAQGHVKEGDFVFLRNTHIRLDTNSKMVGSLHQDRRYPDRVDITILSNFEDDDRVKDVLRRKKDYHKKFDQQSEKYVLEARESKKTNNSDAKNTKPLTKNQRKRKRLAERKLLAQNKSRPPPTSNSTTRKRKHSTASASSSCSSPSTHSTSPPPTKAPKLSALNPNIRCSHHLTPLTPLPTIVHPPYLTNTTPVGTTYTLPFQNVNLRTTARIIDFYPPNLEDFAVRKRKASEYAVLSDHESSDSDDANPASTLPQKDITSGSAPTSTQDSDWEWRFALTLAPPLPSSPTTTSDPNQQPPPETLTAYVAGADAEGLLKLDAEDLRASPSALAGLREKLFLLWGGLEERKRDAKAEKDGGVVAGGRPFQCCLKEYGVKVPIEEGKEGGRDGDGGEGAEEGERGGGEGVRWERRWRLWGCTIV